METIVKKTWRPTVAGILNLAASAGDSCLFLVVIALMLWADFDISFQHMYELIALWGIVLIIGITILVVTISGGIYTLERKKWRWALASSIIASLFCGIGIPALILIVLSNKEFE